MTTTTSTANMPPLGQLFEVDLDLVDRDPQQPRQQANVDADLAPSMAAHGWFPNEPMLLRVHPELDGRFMLVNGERRITGARAAKLKRGWAVLSADVELEVSAGARLARQMLENEGKPLTFVEKAMAFATIIMERRKGIDGAKPDPTYGPTQLAREFGFSKSTVSDALALAEIPVCWRPLIEHGPLSPAHVPELRKWRKVPAKYQERALAQMKDDYRWTHRRGSVERIHVDVLETLLRTFMKKFTRPVSDVPGYTGPTERMSLEYGGAKTYAMDPSLWQPIYRKRTAERRKKNASASRSHGSTPTTISPRQAAADRARERKRQQTEAALPAIAATLAEKIRTAPAAAVGATGALGKFLLAHTIDDSYFEVDGLDDRWVEKQLPAGTASPEALVRHLVLAILLTQLGNQWDRERLFKTIGKELGFKIDLDKIIASTPLPDDDEGDAEDGDGDDASE